MNNTQKENHKKVATYYKMTQGFYGLTDGVYGLASMLQNNSNALIEAGKYSQLDKIIKELIVTTNEVENILFGAEKL
jgi:hypothetical protein